VCLFAVLASAALSNAAPPAFAVASIRPSQAPVEFEHDGAIQTSPGSLIMRDVMISSCIKWAYIVQDSQISGPELLSSARYDIVAKADTPVGDEQLRLMLRTLLADRFKLVFHSENKELPAFVMTLAKGEHKFHESVGDGPTIRQNSATGTIAKSITMREFTDFIAGPLQRPVVDMTGLNGKYDFVLDFTPYLPDNERAMRPDFMNILFAALQGELGIKLESRKTQVEVMVIDRVEKPSEN
jgi:uncharacterized protein (TIGR03435 family)